MCINGAKTTTKERGEGNESGEKTRRNIMYDAYYTGMGAVCKRHASCLVYRV